MLETRLAIIFLSMVYPLSLFGHANDSGSVTRNVLTANEATVRARQISHVSYSLFFNLNKTGPKKKEGGQPFQGKTKIRFVFDAQSRKLSDNLLIDFEGGQIENITINGLEIAVNQKCNERRTRGNSPTSTCIEYDGKKIKIPVSILSGRPVTPFELESDAGPANNEIEIVYTHPYTQTGEGLHWFRDPSDRSVYLYSQGEPNFNSQMFPCFDQPDLKATVEVSVDAPADWTVISNTKPSQIAKAPSNKGELRQLWVFEKSKSFSTYLVELAAGPFQVWESSVDGIPLRLFAPKSIAQYVDYEYWFTITRAGLELFKEAFGFPYPFEKYDQIILAEFNAGAMENVGAVTFNDQYVPRRAMLPTEKLKLAEVVLHEMAHMWFGDLVTMKWWNDLWLNESFATFISYWAIDHLRNKLGFADFNPWQNLFSRKSVAYDEDSYPDTTHPVAPILVRDTEEGRANFDGLSYGKGAAALKQLVFLLGEDGFKAGLQLYFNRHKFGNTELSDFIQCLAQATGRKKELDQWRKDFIDTKGTNSIQAVFETSPKGKITVFQLIQKADSAEKLLRKHNTRIAIFDIGPDGRLKVRKTINVQYAGDKTTINELIGEDTPAFVFPNFDDQDYAQVVLDEASLKTLKEKFSTIEDPLLRQMLWATLWNMVKQAKLPAQEFARLALAHLEGESDQVALDAGLSRLTTSVQFMSLEKRDFYSTQIEEFLSTGLQAAAPGSPHQAIWFDHLVRFAKKEVNLRYFNDLLQKKATLTDFNLNQDRRWALIKALAKNARTLEKQIEITGLISTELQTDQTDKGKLGAISAEVSIPTVANKQLWFNRFTGQAQDAGDFSDSKLATAMRSFSPPGQEDVTAFTTDKFFEALPALASSRKDAYLRSFAAFLFPEVDFANALQKTSTCDASLVTEGTTIQKAFRVASRTESYTNLHGNLSPRVTRTLKNYREDLTRKLRATILSGASP